MSSDTEVIVAGEPLRLLPERAIFWPSKRTLIVADLHWGKEEAFRAGGIPIPVGPLEADLSRLESIIRRTNSERLLILGDLWHDRTGMIESMLNIVKAWRCSLGELHIELVLGNHDLRIGLDHDELLMTIRDRDFVEAPFVFSHFPNASPAGYVLAGHVHPAVMLRGPGKQKLRLPCFWLGDQVCVLPAFGQFTGRSEIVPRAGDRVFAIADGQVIEVQTSSPIREGRE